MTDNELRSLLRDHVTSTEGPFTLSPTESIRRGRAARLRKRRRQAAAGLAAAVAVVAASAPIVISVVSSSDSAEVASDPQPGPTTVAEASGGEQIPQHRRALSVAPADIPATFASMYPGTVTTLTQKEPLVPIVDFLWNGFAVRVGFAQAEYSAGGAIDPDTGAPDFGSWKDAGSPLERCLTDTDDRRDCRVDATGAVTRTSHDTVGGTTMSWAWLYTTDGWNVWVSAANAADTKGAPMLAADAPFTPTQLLRAAQSEVWFR